MKLLNRYQASLNRKNDTANESSNIKTVELIAELLKLMVI